VKRETSLAAIAGVLLLAQGCGSPEETVEPTPAPSNQEQGTRFETRTDTVNTVGGTRPRQEQTPAGTAQARFTVQVGAFKDPHNASRVQSLARDRYHMPVVNDYQGRLGLYQIRIGFFESREAAASFLLRMQQEHPNDYKDSWVVQMKQ